MRIKLNGKETNVGARNVVELLRELNAPQIGVAVAVNERVVRRAEHEEFELHDGDDIELIRAVQGG